MRGSVGPGEFLIAGNYAGYFARAPFLNSALYASIWRERVDHWNSFMAKYGQYLFATNFSRFEYVLYGMNVHGSNVTLYEFPSYFIFHRPSNAPLPDNAREIRAQYASLRRTNYLNDFVSMFLDTSISSSARMYITAHNVGGGYLPHIRGAFERLSLNPDLTAGYQYIASVTAAGDAHEFHSIEDFSRSFAINDLNNSDVHVISTAHSPRIEIDGRNYTIHRHDGILVVVYDSALQGVQDIVTFRIVNGELRLIR